MGYNIPPAIFVFKIGESKKMTEKINGIVLYKGPSMLDKSVEIAVIATGLVNKSKNEKTGEMVQVYILTENIDPQTAHKSGVDHAICGNCKHRGELVNGSMKDRTCYVTLMHGPRIVYSAYKNKAYVEYNKKEHQALFRGKKIRFGTYGDPAAVPQEVFYDLLEVCDKHTSYTHQWNNKSLPIDHINRLKKYCMASVDSAKELAEAQALGWRSYRVLKDSDVLDSKEVMCPAGKITAAKQKVTCENCTLCQGTQLKAKSVAIRVHGIATKKFNLKVLS